MSTTTKIQVQVIHADAFTDRPGMGNSAGVVVDASGLTDAQMQEVARWAGFNESAFVLPPTEEGAAMGADLRLRYFSPGHEVDLCGHATVASLVTLAERGLLPNGGSASLE